MMQSTSDTGPAADKRGLYLRLYTRAFRTGATHQEPIQLFVHFQTALLTLHPNQLILNFAQPPGRTGRVIQKGICPGKG